VKLLARIYLQSLYIGVQAFLINLARVSWKDIDLIPSVEDAWLPGCLVLRELQNMDSYKSAGLDNLNPLFLKLSAEVTPITSLFNLSFVSLRSPKIGKLPQSSPSSKGETL
jgi:hypothetical protein